MLTKMKSALFFYLVLFLNVALMCVDAKADWSRDKDPKRWIDDADDTLKRLVSRPVFTRPAKNIILFLGDGIFISQIITR